MCTKTLLHETIHYTFGSDSSIHFHETLKAIQDMTVFKDRIKVDLSQYHIVAMQTSANKTVWNKLRLRCMLPIMDQCIHIQIILTVAVHKIYKNVYGNQIFV